MVSKSTYPTNIKLYEKQFIIGTGAFGNVRLCIIRFGWQKLQETLTKEN